MATPKSKRNEQERKESAVATAIPNVQVFGLSKGDGWSMAFKSVAEAKEIPKSKVFGLRKEGQQ